MDVKKIVVVVEDVDVSRTALRWSLHNLLRYGDFLTLLHVFSATKSMSKKEARTLRLQGYQLALSFKEICNSNFFNTNIEMIVTEGDQEGRKIVAMVREIGASALVVGLHHQSFLYKGKKGRHSKQLELQLVSGFHEMKDLTQISVPIGNNRLALAHDNIANSLSCRVLAIKQPELPPLRGKTKEMLPPLHGSTTLGFFQIELSGLQVADIPKPKISYRICPSPSAIIWISRRSRKKRSCSNGS